MLTVCRRILVNPKSSRVNGLAKSIVATETIRRLQPTFMRHCSYDGDGKSTGKILNIDHSLGLMIDSYSVVTPKHPFEIIHAFNHFTCPSLLGGLQTKHRCQSDWADGDISADTFGLECEYC